jgi:transglutaminase-like putative cysteine protease
MVRRILLGCAVVLVAASTAFATDSAPGWLQQAATLKVPTYDKQVQAVVLVNEQRVTVSADGRITTTRSFAVRILSHEGRSYAVAAVPYLTDSGKVNDLRAWLIQPSGDVKRFTRDDTLDFISDPNDIYNELRLKFVSARDAADIGSVFGYEATSEERTIFGEDAWRFQDRLPVISARYVLTLPTGWTASSITFNRPELQPQVTGSTYTWEVGGLAPIKDEPASPEVTNLAPRLAISYVPPASSGGSLRTFGSWTDVSRFLSELHDPQVGDDAAVAAKARELTASSTSELEKIQAIGRFVQHLKYISIDIGIGHGGGLRPHSAAEVFAKSYGDCKDKANLMRAMLKAVNITAYTVGIYLGDRTYVREAWASPQQFNHCIIAIKVSDKTQLPTVIDHPKLGRLLIFDATAEDTPVGELPEDEQGSFALLVAGDLGGLVRMPESLPEANRLERKIDATLMGDGTLFANLHENSIGIPAVNYRGEFRHLARADYVRAIEAWVTRGATAAKVSKLEPKDAENQFSLDLEFSAPVYGQLMQDRLLVFKPAMISRRETVFLTDAQREYPIVLGANAFNETANIKLPIGFEVDELPDPVKIDAPFGSYTTTYSVKNGELVFTRSLRQSYGTVPAAQYQAVRSFYERIRAAEMAPVVLARK